MAHPSPLPTLFAPAECAPTEVLCRQWQQFSDIHYLKEFLDAVPTIFLVLNAQRQVVYANRALFEALHLSRIEEVKGQRAGNLLGCVHAQETEGGCGTTEFCRTCGAVHTLLGSLRGNRQVAECSILQQDGSALDLRVSGSPLDINGETYSLFAIEDIGHLKRRGVLERLFFHDVLNMAGVVLGCSQLLLNEPSSDARVANLKQMLHGAVVDMIDEIETQRDLSAAENGELTLHLDGVSTLDVLLTTAHAYQVHEVGAERSVVVDPAAQDCLLHTDQVLVERVIGNLVKNALEATQPGETVTLACAEEGDQVVFSVHNPGVMPRAVQLQVFQRSFSTHGRGRGLGTYSVKLLAERYLGGTVTFTSTPDDGTVFRVSLPHRLEPPSA